MPQHYEEGGLLFECRGNFQGNYHKFVHFRYKGCCFQCPVVILLFKSD